MYPSLALINACNSLVQTCKIFCASSLLFADTITPPGPNLH